MRHISCCITVLWVALSPFGGLHAQQSLVFRNGMEGHIASRWTANACEISCDEQNRCEGQGSLKLVDHGGNAQVYVLLSTERRKTYRVTCRAYRAAANKGEWHGKMAVSVAGGAVTTGNYLAESEFIRKPDSWETLELEFKAPADRVYVILAGQNGAGDVTFFDDVRIESSAKPMKPVAEDLAAKRKPIQTVTLAGTPEQIGALWGRINRTAVREDMEKYYLARARKSKIPTGTLLRRAECFVELSKRFAPHWLTEARTIAKAADVDPDLYISFLANVYRGLYRHDECTSYSVSREFTKDGRIFFHKNRDNAPKKQSVFILDTAVEGVNKFIAVTDASVIACMMMVNDKGLAGSADTGGLKVDKPKYRGMMNTSLLRHIAERASTCDDALKIVQDFVKNGWYAGGSRTGTHWLFVDASGKRIEISNNSDAVEHRFHTGKVYFSARSKTNAPKILEAAEPPIDFATFHNVSRDPAMCFRTSVSGMSVEISREHPGTLTCAWISLPAKTLSFPLFIGGTETPLALMNGEVFSIAKDLHCNREIWERIEAGAFTSQRLLEADVSALLAKHKRDDAVRTLNHWVRTCTDSHLAILTAMREAWCVEDEGEAK